MKQLAIVVVLLIAISSLAYSQAKPGGYARELAMGGSNTGVTSMSVMNPFIIDDPSLMFFNPAYQASYKDYAWFNVGGGAMTGLSNSGGSISDDGYYNQNAGVAFGLNDSWNLGVILSYDPSLVNFNSQLPSTIVQAPRNAQFIPPVRNVWELVASTRMTNLDLGFAVMYGYSNSESKFNNSAGSITGDSSTSSRVMGVRAGVNVNLGGGSSFDAAAAFRLDKADDKETGTPIASTNSGEYSSSGTEFDIMARGKFNVSSKFNFVPFASLSTASASPNEDTRPDGITTTPFDISFSLLTFAVGAGGEYRTGNFYFAGGLSFESFREKVEQTPGSAAPPAARVTTTSTLSDDAIPVINLGMEWTLTDWLTGRAGYFRWLGSVDQKIENPGYTAEFSQTNPNSFVSLGGINASNWDGLVTLGVGLKFSGFALDATVSEEALRRGLGLIGAQDNINTFGYLTASYNFGE